METTGSPGLSGLKITQPSGNKYAMLAVSAGSFTPDYVNDIDEKIVNKSVKNNTENNDNQLEDKISSYQNTNREKTLMRELKRLQNFQTFLVAQIDQLGRHRKSDQLAKEINDLKRAILRIPRTPLTTELARKSNNNSDRKRKKKKSRRTVGSQTAAPRSMKAMTNRIDDFCDYSNNIDDDINNTSSNKVIMSPTGNASSLPSLFSNNDNLNQQQQRFMEEKEVHAAFEYASENFGKVYREMDEKNFDLTSKLLERDTQLVEAKLKIERLKRELLGGGGSKKVAVDAATKKEIELLKLRLYDKMDENKRLRRRLQRNKIRAVILERQKKEIIRLQMKQKSNESVPTRSRIKNNDILIETTPRNPHDEYSKIRMHKSTSKDNSNRQYTQSLLRKNSELKGYNHALMAQRNFLIQKLGGNKRMHRDFTIRNGGQDVVRKV